jgi:LAGLIDADG-like domain
MGSPWRKQYLKPTLHPTMADIIFAAGFYEGEGTCIGNSKRGGCYVQITQRDGEILKRMRELFGGNLYLYQHGNGSYYRLALGGPRARGFAMTIFSFLSRRRKEQLKAVFSMDLGRT